MSTANTPAPIFQNNIWKRLTFYKVLSICFPVSLVLCEIAIRNVFKVEISSFIGPSLAAGGLGLLIESVKPKKVDTTSISSLTTLNIPQGFVLRNERDENLVRVAWVLVLFCFFLWIFSCVNSFHETNFILSVEQDASTVSDLESSKTPDDLVTQKKGVNFVSASFLLGILNYLVGSFLSTLKENE